MLSLRRLEDHQLERGRRWSRVCSGNSEERWRWRSWPVLLRGVAIDVERISGEERDAGAPPGLTLACEEQGGKSRTKTEIRSES